MFGLSNEELKKLIEAINENRSYNYSENGLTVKANSTDNSLYLSIEKDDSVNREVNEFHKFLDGLDNELFVEVCEYINNEDLQKIQKCVDSDNLETVRAGITKFKSYLSKYAKDRIKYYQKYI